MLQVGRGAPYRPDGEICVICWSSAFGVDCCWDKWWSGSWDKWCTSQHPLVLQPDHHHFLGGHYCRQLLRLLEQLLILLLRRLLVEHLLLLLEHRLPVAARAVGQVVI